MKIGNKLKKVKVIRVLSGNCFMTNEIWESIKIYNKSSLEKGDTGFEIERNKLRKLIKGKTVWIEYIKKNIYGQNVCKVYLDVGEQLK